MVPSDVHAKFGSDLCRIEKVSGTPFFPGPGGSGLWAGGELPGERRLTGPFSSPVLAKFSNSPDPAENRWAVAHGPKCHA